MGFLTFFSCPSPTQTGSQFQIQKGKRHPDNHDPNPQRSLVLPKITKKSRGNLVTRALYKSISASILLYTHTHTHTIANNMISSISYPKTLHPLQVFSMKLSPSSTISFRKIKTLIHTLIFSHVRRIARALSKAKTILIEVVKEIQPVHFMYSSQNKNKNKNKKLFFGSFRLHYNWCSSHVVPVPAPILGETYYDSTWNSVLSTEQTGEATAAAAASAGDSSQLSGYLQWLEEKVHDNSDKDINDIDKLAEMFIASSHEKFQLEKQESARRFQEMMARSM